MAERALQPGDRIAVPSVYGQLGFVTGRVRELLGGDRVYVHLDGIGPGTWPAADVTPTGEWRWIGRVKFAKRCVRCGSWVRPSGAGWWHPGTKAMACPNLECIRQTTGADAR